MTPSHQPLSEDGLKSGEQCRTCSGCGCGVLGVWVWGTWGAQASQTPNWATNPPGHLPSPSPIGSHASSLGTITQPEQELLDSYCSFKKEKAPLNIPHPTVLTLRVSVGVLQGCLYEVWGGVSFLFVVFLIKSYRVLKTKAKRLLSLPVPNCSPKQKCVLPSERLDRVWSSQVWWKCPCPQQGWNGMSCKAPSNPN